MVKYSEIENISINKWGDFIKKHPQGNIFQTPEMYGVYQKTKNYEPLIIGIVDKSNGLIISHYIK